jgi:hypothetical protein
MLTKLLELAAIFRFMKESRAAPRQRVLKAGAIEFSGGGAIGCAVKNLSAVGAALELGSALDIPDRLTLSIPAERRRKAVRPLSAHVPRELVGRATRHRVVT